MGNMPLSPGRAAHISHPQATTAHATFVAGLGGNHCAQGDPAHSGRSGRQYFRRFQVSVGVSARLRDW